MDQLISHFHEFRKEFLAQCEVFRREIQGLRDSSVRQSGVIDSIEVDIEEMQKELHKFHKTISSISSKTKATGLMGLLNNPLVLFAAVIFFLILLISDLKVEKENGLLKDMMKVIPGAK